MGGLGNRHSVFCPIYAPVPFIRPGVQGYNRVAVRNSTEQVGNVAALRHDIPHPRARGVVFFVDVEGAPNPPIAEHISVPHYLHCAYLAALDAYCLKSQLQVALLVEPPVGPATCVLP
jgi:hypothetical protein